MIENDKQWQRISQVILGTKVLYEHNPDSDKTKRPKWCKGTIKIDVIQGNTKF